jgi:hypothetical protein
MEMINDLRLMVEGKTVAQTLHAIGEMKANLLN